MNEFLDRIAAQRDVLDLVNAIEWSEPLAGLSSGALGRWCQANALAADDALVRHLYALSDKLAFLANRSQEQVSDAYEIASADVLTMTADLRGLLQRLGTG